jgi:hypothetical protein
MDMVSLLTSKGFTHVQHVEHVLPDTDDFWNGPNVTFYVSKK